MDNLQDRVTKILNEHDPIGLIVIGASKDEYSMEAGGIAGKLPSCRSAAEVNELIYNTFVKFFEYGTRLGESKTEHINPGRAGKKEERKITRKCLKRFLDCCKTIAKGINNYTK